MDSKAVNQEVNPNIRKFNHITAKLRARLKRIPKPEKQPYKGEEKQGERPD